MKNNAITAEKLTHAWNLFSSARSIIFLTHKRPDADGISACTALSHIAQEMGKYVETIYPTQPEFPIKRQPENVHINSHFAQPDLIIACDTANYERLYYPETFKKIPLINIDHHISNSIQGTINFVDVNVSSTCELLVQILEHWNPKLITKPVAQALLFGILYDTQIFRIPSTTPETLRISAKLIEKGASLYDLKHELLAHKNPAIIRLWSEILSSVQTFSKPSVAAAIVTQSMLLEENLTLSSLTGFNNFLAEIADIDVTILAYETEDGATKVSLRSQITDVNAVANHFGGGGHIHAAGIVMETSPEKCVAVLIKELKKKKK